MRILKKTGLDNNNINSGVLGGMHTWVGWSTWNHIQLFVRPVMEKSNSDRGRWLKEDHTQWGREEAEWRSVREKGVGEGSSTLSQLSLTYMERVDNNKCLCVRVLEAVQILCSHNCLLPTPVPTPELTWAQIPPCKQDKILISFYFIYFIAPSHNFSLKELWNYYNVKHPNDKLAMKLNPHL